MSSKSSNTVMPGCSLELFKVFKDFLTEKGNCNAAAQAKDPKASSCNAFSIDPDDAKKTKKIAKKVCTCWTTTDLCENIIKPLTKSVADNGKEASFHAFLHSHQKSSLSSLPLSKNVTSPQKEFVELFLEFYKSRQLTYVLCFPSTKADVFVSHAWAYKFVDVVEGIESFRETNKDKSSFYFDLWVNDQHKAVTLDFKWWTDTFRHNVKEIQHTCMILTPWSNPVPFTRAWCLWELYCTLDTQTPLTIQMSVKEKENFIFTLETQYREVIKNFSQIDVSTSECWKEDDRLMIHDIVSGVNDHDSHLKGVVNEFGVGFPAINGVISKFMREWMIGTTKEIFFKRNDAPEPTADKYGILGNLCSDFNQHEEAIRHYETSIEGYSKLPNCKDKKLRSYFNIANCLKQKLSGNLEDNKRDSKKLYERIIDEVDKNNSRDKLDFMIGLANWKSDQKLWSEAEADYVSIIKKYKDLGDDKKASYPINLIMVEQNLANVFKEQGRLDEAEALYTATLERCQDKFTKNHFNTQKCLTNFANLLYSKLLLMRDKGEPWKLEDVKKIKLKYEDAINVYRSKEFDQKRLDRAHVLHCLGTFLNDAAMNQVGSDLTTPLMAYLEESARHYNEAIEIRKEHLGLNNPDTLQSITGLGNVQYALKKFETAEKRYLEALAGYLVVVEAAPTDQQKLNWDVEVGRAFLAIAIVQDELNKDCEENYKQAITCFRRGTTLPPSTATQVLGSPPQNPPTVDLAVAEIGLASFLCKPSSKSPSEKLDLDRVISLYESGVEALLKEKKGYGPKHLDTLSAQNSLAAAYVKRANTTTNDVHSLPKAKELYKKVEAAFVEIAQEQQVAAESFNDYLKAVLGRANLLYAEGLIKQSARPDLELESIAELNEAEKLFNMAVKGSRQKPSIDVLKARVCIGNINASKKSADAAHIQREFEEILHEFEEKAKVHDKELHESDIFVVKNSLANIMSVNPSADLEKTAKLYRSSFEGLLAIDLRKAAGDAAMNLAYIYKRLNDRENAKEFYARAYEIYSTELYPRHPEAIMAKSYLDDFGEDFA